MSVTAGTIFQGTRKPLQMWFRAMWWVTSQKNGASAKGLQQSLGLGSYQTAWAWLHKLRRAMVRPGRDQLSGLVEVDETYVGGHENRPGRDAPTKTLVVIAIEKRGRGLGRTRMATVRKASRTNCAGLSNALWPRVAPSEPMAGRVTSRSRTAATPTTESSNNDDPKTPANCCPACIAWPRC